MNLRSFVNVVQEEQEVFFVTNNGYYAFGGAAGCFNELINSKILFKKVGEIYKSVEEDGKFFTIHCSLKDEEEDDSTVYLYDILSVFDHFDHINVTKTGENNIPINVFSGKSDKIIFAINEDYLKTFVVDYMTIIGGTLYINGGKNDA